MRVAGCDYSSRFVDLVTIPLDGPGAPVWHRFPLTGADAFDRARSVAQAVPGPTSVLWDDILSVGIEHPAGKHGTGPLLRIQGAILTRIPPRMLVEPLPPAKWRKLVGLPGNASKERVADMVMEREYQTRGWEQDTFDAYCLALATLRLLDREGGRVNRGNVILKQPTTGTPPNDSEQPTIGRCALCGWTLEGTLAETRAAHLEHRQEAHPEVQPKRQLKPRRKGQINLGKTIDENIAGVRGQGGAGWHRT